MTKCLSKCPSSTKSLPSPSYPENFWLHASTQALSFLQTAPSKMFDSVLNTSVSITAQ